MAAPLGVISIGASLAGGILGAQGATQSAAATQQMYNYQSQVAKINSQIDTQNAEYARVVGEREAEQYGLKAAQQFGQIRAAQGASGLDVNSGSATDVQASQRKITAMDLATIRQNAAKTAYDYDVRATADLNQSTLDIMAGENAVKAGKIQAMQSILGSVSSVSSKWLQGSQMGMFETPGLMASSSVGI